VHITTKRSEETPIFSSTAPWQSLHSDTAGLLRLFQTILSVL